MLKVILLNKSGIQKKDTKDISIIFKEKSINNNHIDKIETLRVVQYDIKGLLK